MWGNLWSFLLSLLAAADRHNVRRRRLLLTKTGGKKVENPPIYPTFHLTKKGTEKASYLPNPSVPPQGISPSLSSPSFISNVH